MAVNPVMFQGMMQNTPEISNIKAQEDHKPMVQQDQVSVTVQREAEQSTQQVNSSQETSEDTFDPERGGDGSGYNADRKKKKKKKAVRQAVPEGSVRRKSSHPSFDASI